MPTAGFSKTEMHNPAQPIYIIPYREESDLCPVKNLFLLETKLSRLRPRSDKRFWISSKKPNRGISRQAMSSWLKSVIKRLVA